MRLGRLGPTRLRAAAVALSEVPSTTTCAAPESTLYFAPDGRVLACCVNNAHPLGQVGEESLREIWQGARIAALRTALRSGDFSLGCDECGDRADAGNRAWSNAPQFDRWATDCGVPPFPRRMDFVLSNRCNLMCHTCNGYWSSAIRSRRERRPPLPSRYGDAFFRELEEFLPHLEHAVFLGGEPFLAREPRRVWDLLRVHARPGLEIQVVSNGTQWDSRIEQYLTELPMSVSVSVDGATPETFEHLRVGAEFATVMANVDRYEAAVTTHGGRVGYHYCLLVQNWQEFGRFLLKAEARGRSVQVMTVTQPADFSLFHLPSDALERVITALERENDRIGPELRELRPVWDAERDRLRRHLAALRRGSPPRWVEVGSPRRSHRATPNRTIPTGQLAAHVGNTDGEADLERWSDRPLLVLHGRDGVVTGHDAPTWAATLDPEALVGVRVNELDGALAQHIGPCTSLDIAPSIDGTVSVEATFDTPTGPVWLRAIAAEWGGMVRVNRVALALRQGAPPSSERAPDGR